jgi:murein DD-endopeptidase MepM/ murein hydrolase activator NlpD
MKGITDFLNYWITDFWRFVGSLFKYTFKRYLVVGFSRFESFKSLAVVKMYQQRGKYSQLFVHGGVALVMSLGVALGPSLVVQEAGAQSMISNGVGGAVVIGEDQHEVESKVLGTMTDSAYVQPLTEVSDKPRAEDLEYSVQPGDTLSSIGEKFGVSMDTIRWSNPDKVKSVKATIKEGEMLIIPPVTGVVHKVKSGETVYSIAKKYDISAQGIVDFPFNEFSNDETFALAVGQTLMVPDGVVQDVQPWSPTSGLARVLTPDAGAVSATGSWIWPASGRITQRYLAWHKGIDIANKSGGAILAADSGRVVVAGWLDNAGYGNRVMVDHGNGYQTLYAHLSKISVKVGQSVKRGDVLGSMGSTGRSTGTHLHFEIRTSRGNINPFSVLK